MKPSLILYATLIKLSLTRIIKTRTMTKKCFTFRFLSENVSSIPSHLCNFVKNLLQMLLNFSPKLQLRFFRQRSSAKDQVMLAMRHRGKKDVLHVRVACRKACCKRIRIKAVLQHCI